MNNNILEQSGEYLIITTKKPYLDVSEFTNINEDVIDNGINTMYKKEFRYSLNGDIYSEYKDLTIDNLKKLGSFDTVYFQFRYILLSGGPLQINDVVLDYIPSDNQKQLSLNTNSDSLYTYKTIYKSGCSFDPYKMDKAISLYKDLNLMANELYGLDVYYYRVDPNKQHQDVVLQEYTLFEYQDKKLIKIVVPENAVPQSTLTVNPFGVDFELPFEIQILKDYFQNIFGENSGPQKRDIVYFPLTNRIYEVASSVLYNDFMYTPIYFKVQLIKWQVKNNVEKNQDIKTLESYTIKADDLFLDTITAEEKDITNEQQFNMKTTTSDFTRSFIDNDLKIFDYAIVNYYTVISEYYYDLGTALKDNIIKLNVDNLSFEKNKDYYVRIDRNNNLQSEMNLSMKILLNLNDTIFSYKKGNSIYEKNYFINDLFNDNSNYNIYKNEYSQFETDELVSSCKLKVASERNKAIEYNFENDFSKNKDIAYSAWFKLNENKKINKYNILAFNYDNYLYTLKINVHKKCSFLLDDDIIIKRNSDSDFLLLGKIKNIISPTEFEIDVNKEIYDIMILLYPSWQNYTDLYVSKHYTFNFISSYDNNKGIKIDMIDNKFVICTLNDKTYYTYLKDNIKYDNWYSIFVNISNTFKQLGVNIWQIQWNPKTNEPKTTRLNLLVSDLIDIPKEDRNNNIKYYINSSYMNLTNIRLYNRTINTDKQDTLLNQYIVQESHICDIIDNAEGQLKYPYVGSTK